MRKLKGLLRPINTPAGRQDRYDKGIGVAAYAKTKLFNPFHRTDVSARPTVGRHVRSDGDAVPSMPSKMSGAARTATALAVEGPRLRALKQAPDLQAMLAGAYPDAQPYERTALADSLTDIARSGGLTSPELHLLSGALMQAHPLDMSEAAACLAGLCELRLVEALAHPSSSPPTDEARLAWAFAAALVALVPGKAIDLLDKVTDGALNGNAGEGGARRAPWNAQQRDGVLCYLIAAREIGGTAVDPHSIYAMERLAACIDESRRQAHRDGAVARKKDVWPGRAGAALPLHEDAGGSSAVRLNLYEKALLAVHDMLDPAVTEVHGCAFAAYRVLNGLASGQATNADGSQSDEHYIMARTRKGRTWMDRARAPRGRRAAFKLALTHRGKSPYLVVNKVVSPQGMDARMTLSHNNGIHHGRAMKDMIGTLEQALDQRGGPGGSPLPTRKHPIPASAVRPDEVEGLTTLRNLVRRSLLSEARGEVGPLFTRYNLSRAIPPDRIDAARAAVLDCIRPADGAAGSPPRWPQDITAAVDALLADAGSAPPDASDVEEGGEASWTGTAQNRPLTPQCLLDWAADVGGPRDEAAAMELEPGEAAFGEPDWARFASSYARVARNEAPEPEIVSLEGKSHKDACLVIAEMIRGKHAGDNSGEELASSFTLEHGGNSGFNTGSVMQRICGVLLGFFRCHVDAGVQHTRRVSFESRNAAERSGIVMRVQTFVRMSLGAGGLAGIKGSAGPVGGSVAVGVSASHVWKLASEEGVNWNFPRDRSGGLANDQQLADKKARLFLLLNGVADPQGGPYRLPGNPEDRSTGGLPDLINLALQEFGPSLSINRYKVEQSLEMGPTLEVAAGAGVSKGPVVVGLAPTKLFHDVRTSVMHQKDLTGSYRVDRETRHEHVVDRATGALAMLLGQANDWEQAGSVGTLDAVVSVSPLAQGAVDVRRKGVAEATVRISRNHKTLPTSYLSTSYDRPNDFYKAYGARLESNVEDMNKKFYPGRHAEDAARERGKQMAALGQFVGRHATRQDMTMKFADWYELGDYDDSDTALRAQAHLDGARGDAVQAAAARAEADQLLREPGNQESRYVIALNTRSVGMTLGVNGQLGATHNGQYTYTERSPDFI
ncbi:hypothetical protein [Xylophilus ampelinus]|uniref:hypothetical protein n=1 Tax=Xylophilus ampelinus TaxID=54067 RepID=UPI000D7C021D|nr:hypothetical protein [Xylophilus ampelinus]MCS4510308.1 hypothetical protein [Xylophilus ampelinus]